MKSAALGVVARTAPYALNTAGKQRLAILIYHRVLPQLDPLRPGEPSVEEFDWQVRLLRRHFNPLPLEMAVERLNSQTLPPRAVCVTFDDGYADNEQLALPVLRKYEVPATVFVSSGFLNGGRMFNDTVIEAVRAWPRESLDLTDIGLDCYATASIDDRRACIDSILTVVKHRDPVERTALVGEIEKRVEQLPDDLMMTNEQVRALAAGGVTIGAHTLSHPILSSVTADVARKEIAQSKQQLENITQAGINTFAYPNGRPGDDYTSAHRDMVHESGFKLAVSTHWGVATSESDCFQLPRFTPWDRSEARFALRLLWHYRNTDSLP